MGAATKAPPRAGANGAVAADPMVEAIAHEEAIAGEASEIRAEATELTPELFMRLWPLLKRPIPQAFIQTVGRVEGKPYESTGIRSVQVQVDRMNNVLTPMWWWEKISYERDGKLAIVTICVGSNYEEALLSRKSAGGVERGSSTGNVYKGSYTNAAKLAFARIGVGHEIYLGATDLDPDVSTDIAERAAAEGPAEPEAAAIGREIAKKMVARAVDIEPAKRQLQLAASHVAGRDVGDCSTQAKAVKALAALSFEQAEKVDNWISKKADEVADS